MDPDDLMEVGNPKVLIEKENKIATPSNEEISKKASSVYEGGRKSKNKDK